MPSSSSISSDVGWMVAARWSLTGAGSCSNTVTGTPRRLSASAQTMPTGPAPTTTTRAVAFTTIDLRSRALRRGVLGLRRRRDLLHGAAPAALGDVEDEAFRRRVLHL